MKWEKVASTRAGPHGEYVITVDKEGAGGAWTIYFMNRYQASGYEHLFEDAKLVSAAAVEAMIALGEDQQALKIQSGSPKGLSIFNDAKTTKYEDVIRVIDGAIAALKKGK